MKKNTIQNNGDIPQKRTQFQEVVLRLRKNRQAMLGLTVFLLIVVACFLAPLYLNYDANVIQQNISNKLAAPSAEHFLGTDGYGRDVMSRLIYGGRISITIGVVTAICALFAGGIIGAIAGFYGGQVDNILMRIMDVFLSLPSTLLAIAVIASLGSSITNLMIAVAVSYVPVYARVIRSSVLSIRNKEYIESARAIGTSDFRIIMRHIIPNAIGPVIVQATLGVGEIIIAAAGFSFLGLGIQPPLPEWGQMLSEGKEVIRSMPSQVVFPGLCIMITVLCLNLLGDGLRDALDPRLK